MPSAVPAQKPEDLTPIAQAREGQERPGVVREVNGFFGFGNEPIYAIRFVILRKQEENDALRAAHAYAKVQAQGNDEARVDPDLLLDAKHVEILFRACKDPTSGRPAFPGPQWMRDRLTGDEIGVLVHIYNEVRAKCGPISYDLSRESLDAIVDAISKASGTDLPDLVLERFPREVLTSMVVMLAEDLVALRAPAAEPAEPEAPA